MKCPKCGTELVGGRYEANETGICPEHTPARCLDIVCAQRDEAERGDAAESALAAERARGKRLWEALTWYAKSENYMHKFERVRVGVTGDDPQSVLTRMYAADEKIEAGWRPVVLDAGERARAALATPDAAGASEDEGCAADESLPTREGSDDPAAKLTEHDRSARESAERAAWGRAIERVAKLIRDMPCSHWDEEVANGALNLRQHGNLPFEPAAKEPKK